MKTNLSHVILTASIFCLQSRSVYQKRNILDSKFKEKGSLLIKIFLYFQILMNATMPMLAALVIAYESDPIQMLMDFVSLVVITDIDNWCGSLFEIFLDSLYQEETLDNPKYLDFETDSLSKASSFIWVLFTYLPTFTLNIVVTYANIQKLCPNLE